MPKNKNRDYLSNYIYKPKNKNNVYKKNITKKLFVFLLTVSSLFILVFFANIFSSMIKPGVIPLNRGDKYSPEMNFYAVELGVYTSIGEASEASEEYKQQTAAGYIVNDGNTYRVLASIYQTRTNAESVVQNLTDSDVEASIYKISVPAIYMDLNLEGEQKQLIKNALGLWKETYVDLYNIVISLDKGEKTIDQCKIEVMNLKNELETKVAEVQANIGSASQTEIIYIKVYLNMLLDKLTELEEVEFNSKYSSSLKEVYCSVIYDYLNLKTELAKN